MKTAHQLLGVTSPSLGSSLLSNPNFDSGLTGWSTVTSPTTIEVADGRAHIVGDSANDGIGQNVTLTLNAQYELRFNYEVISGALNVLKTGMTSILSLTGSGTYVHHFTESDGTNRTLRWVTGAAGEFFIDNLSLRKIL